MNLVHTADMERLPPFDALVAFDAAVRLRSMTEAASELGLTQSAVSHRIRRLEAFMGAALLYRRGGGLAPTPAGEALTEGLDTLLVQLAELRARCVSASGRERLRVGVGAALTQAWLLRRLPDFTARHPHIAIELEIVDAEASAPAADLDVRLMWVPTDELRSTSTQRPLFQEQVFPVCRGSLLPAGFSPGDPSVLMDLPLLHKGRPGRGTSGEWSWPVWLTRLGLPPRPRESLRFASIDLAIAAAIEGAGVALGRTLLVHDALAEGRLVRVLPERWDMPCGKSYLIRWPSARCGDDRVRGFVDWLSAEACATQREIIAAA
jgi:LysR family glycine cleavage system transcriptional activator